MADLSYSEGEGQRRWRDVAVPTVRMRRQSQSALIGQCIQIANRYNAEYAIPVQGTAPDTPHPVLSPALVNEAIDVPAVRASSTNPAILTPWLFDSEQSRTYADRRRKILASTYSRSRFNLLRRRFFRQLAGYGFASVVVIPEDITRDKHPTSGAPIPLARISLRNALTTYADPQAPEEIDLPTDVGFVHQISGSQLRHRYPSARAEYGGVIPEMRNEATGDMWDVLEWIDSNYCLIGIMGQTRDSNAFRQATGSPQLLKWYPNRVGLVPAVVPSVITLDKLVSRLTHMIGKSDLLAYLWQLDIEAMQRAVAPDRYAIAGDGDNPEIVSHDGKWMDGRTGEINLLRDVKQVGELRGAPDPNNLARMGQLEANARTETGILGPTSGSAAGMAGALRTGRGIDSLLSASVDPKIAELQEVAAQSLTILNEAVFATYKSYWPSRRFTVFSGWPGERGMVEFVPERDIETTANLVYYPMPGVDAYQQTVMLAQMVQAEMISRQSARRMHPQVDDAAAEEQAIAEERIDMLVWQALSARAAQGGLPPIDAAELIKHVRAGETIENAIMKADAAARERQAGTTDQQGTPLPAPPPPGAPAGQPGLGNPGEGSAAGEGAPPPGGQQQLTPEALIAALQQRPTNAPGIGGSDAAAAL